MTELNDKTDFEEAYNALQDVVTQLENPQNKIEDNIALYEQACKLVLHCRRKLDEAKTRIVDINERIAQLKSGDDTLFED